MDTIRVILRVMGHSRKYILQGGGTRTEAERLLKKLLQYLMKK